MEMKIAKQRYNEQRKATKGRTDALGTPIKFLLTFDEWVDIWDTSGKYEQRGIYRGQYVMSRHNDIGNYELGNVVIKCGDQNRSEANKGENNPMYGKTPTTETRAKISAANMGHEVSEETRKKISAARMGLPKVTCPHCQLVGDVGAMKRWHFDNCKQNQKKDK